MEKSNPSPPVLFWYRIYCAIMAILYYGLILLFAIVWIWGWGPRLTAERESFQWLYIGYTTFVFSICSTLAVFFTLPFFLKPRPWVWIYHLIAIAVGFTSPCTMPASIALFIFWIKPETQAYFGRSKSL